MIHAMHKLPATVKHVSHSEDELSLSAP
jgi:hypothetical protein